MIKVTAHEGQNIFDIAMQAYGSIEGVRHLIKDNPGLSGWDADLSTGQVLLIDETKIVNRDLVEYYLQNRILINTGQPILIAAGSSQFDYDFDFDLS